MQIEPKDIVIGLFSFFGGGGFGLLCVKLFIQQQAKAALKGDLDKIVASITELKTEVNQAINCKVSKDFCSMQHSNLDKLLTSMDNKLDAVLAKL